MTHHPDRFNALFRIHRQQNPNGVFKSPLEDFRKAVEEAGFADRVRYLSHGETYQFEVNKYRTQTSAK